jgi:hypothetical protein
LITINSKWHSFTQVLLASEKGKKPQTRETIVCKQDDTLCLSASFTTTLLDETFVYHEAIWKPSGASLKYTESMSPQPRCGDTELSGSYASHMQYLHKARSLSMNCNKVLRGSSQISIGILGSKSATMFFVHHWTLIVLPSNLEYVQLSASLSGSFGRDSAETGMENAKPAPVLVKSPSSSERGFGPPENGAQSRMVGLTEDHATEEDEVTIAVETADHSKSQDQSINDQRVGDKKSAATADLAGSMIQKMRSA